MRSRARSRSSPAAAASSSPTSPASANRSSRQRWRGRRSAAARVSKSSCPRHSQGQWNETLRRFGVNANVVTHDAIIHDTRVPEPRRRLIIVDEAHAFRNPRTQRYDALARRSVGAQLLLVTATPLCNSARDLRALIDMIAADDVLAGRGVPSIDAAFELDDREAIARVVAELVIRRDRMVLSCRVAIRDARCARHSVRRLRRRW